MKKKGYYLSTYRVWNFHKDNWREIVQLLSTNVLYSFLQMTLPSLIALRSDVGVFLVMACYYTILQVVLGRNKMSTLYGKVLYVISLMIGGYAGYLTAPYFDRLLSIYFQF